MRDVALPAASKLLAAVLVVGMLCFGALALAGGAMSVKLVLLPGGYLFLVLSLPCLIGGAAMVCICASHLRHLIKPPGAPLAHA